MPDEAMDSVLPPPPAKGTSATKKKVKKKAAAADEPAGKAPPKKRKVVPNTGADNPAFQAFCADREQSFPAAKEQLVNEAGGEMYLLTQLWGRVPEAQKLGYGKIAETKRIEELALKIFMDEGESFLKTVGASTVKAGGGAEHVMQHLWQDLAAEKRQVYVESAYSQDLRQRAYKKFCQERRKAVFSIDRHVRRDAGGNEAIYEKMWQDLSDAQQLVFVNHVATDYSHPPVAAIQRRPLQPKQAPLSAKSKSTTDTYQFAAYDAIVALQEKNGCTVESILQWLELNQPQNCDEAVLEASLARGLRGKKFERPKLKYVYTASLKKLYMENERRELDIKVREQKLEARRKLEEERLKKQARDEEEKRMKDQKRKNEADGRQRKARLGGRKYPVDDLQALSEALLCDQATMRFQEVAVAKKSEQEQIAERKRELARQSGSMKDKFSAGLRVQMLLEEDGQKEFYGGHVITVQENGLDIFFDDGDFQQNVAFDDEDLQIVQPALKKEEEPVQSLQLENLLVAEFPASLQNNDIPSHLLADLISISDFLTRFDIGIGPISATELVGLIRTSAANVDEDEGAVVHLRLRNELHVKLLQFIGVERMPEHEFMSVEMTDEMIDAHTWPEVLGRYISASCPEYGCTDELLESAKVLLSKSYDALGMEAKVSLLSYLCSDALDGEEARDVLDEDTDKYDDLLRNFDESEKTLARKDAEKLKMQKDDAKKKVDEERQKKKDDEDQKKKERADKLEEDRDGFKKWLASENITKEMKPQDDDYKELWKKWRLSLQLERKNEKNKLAAEERQKERDRIQAEEKAAKAAEKVRKEEEKAAAKAAKEAAKVQAKADKAAAKKEGAHGIPKEYTLSRGETLKKIREEREAVLREEREKREQEIAVKLAAENAVKAKVQAEFDRREKARKEWGRYNKEYLKDGSATETVTRAADRKKNKQNRLDEELEQVTDKMQPLGRDRFHNRYWWSTANPDKVYIEMASKGGGVEKVSDVQVPPLVRAWMESDSDTHQAAQKELRLRLAAHPAGLKEQLKILDLDRLGIEINPEEPGGASAEQAVDKLLSLDLLGGEPYIVEFANTSKVVKPRKAEKRGPRGGGGGGAAAGNGGGGAAADSGNSAGDAGTTNGESTELSNPGPAESHSGAGMDTSMEVSEEEEEEEEQESNESDEDGLAAEADAAGWRKAQDEWRYYDQPEQLQRLCKSLNPAGSRERQLKQQLEQRLDRISDAMASKRKRRGGGSGSKTLPDCGATLAKALRGIQDDFFPNKVVAGADCTKWAKSLSSCSLWLDFIEPMQQLGLFFDKLGGGSAGGSAEGKQATAALLADDSAGGGAGRGGGAGGEWVDGDVVWVKMRNFPWWPSIICPDPISGATTKSGKYHASYFGDDSHSFADVENIKPFLENVEEFNLVSTKGTKKGRPNAKLEEAVAKANQALEDAAAAATAVKEGAEEGAEEVAVEEEDAEMDWGGWLEEWAAAVGDAQREGQVVFLAYALRARVHHEFAELVKVKKASGRGGGKRVAPSPKKPMSKSKGGRSRGRVNYAEEALSSDESSDEEQEEEEFGAENLLAAAQSGNRMQLRKILDAGVDIDAVDTEEQEQGKTALMHAVAGGHKSCVKLLLDRGADVDIVDVGDQYSAAMYAAEGDHPECLSLLTKQARADIELRDQHGRTAFLIACETGNGSIIDLLVKCGCDMSAKENEGKSGWQLARDESPPHDHILEILDGHTSEKDPSTGKPQRKPERSSGRQAARKSSRRAAAESSESESEEGGDDDDDDDDDVSSAMLKDGDGGDYAPAGRGSRRSKKRRV